MADPSAIPLAVATAETVQLIGLPEGADLAHATVHLATAPKSNAVTMALGAAANRASKAGKAGWCQLFICATATIRARPRWNAQGTSMRTTNRGVCGQQYPPDVSWSESITTPAHTHGG